VLIGGVVIWRMVEVVMMTDVGGESWRPWYMRPGGFGGV
jgi:hypothetical protein